MTEGISVKNFRYFTAENTTGGKKVILYGWISKLLKGKLEVLEIVKYFPLKKNLI